jgi:hypothetical protein
MHSHFNPGYLLETIDAGNAKIRTDGFMHVDLLPDALGLAKFVSLTLHDTILTVQFVGLSHVVTQNLVTSKFMVVAKKLQVLQLLLDFLLN